MVTASHFHDIVLGLSAVLLSGHKSISDLKYGRGGNDSVVPRRGPGGRGRRPDVSEPRHVRNTNTICSLNFIKIFVIQSQQGKNIVLIRC